MNTTMNKTMNKTMSTTMNTTSATTVQNDLRFAMAVHLLRNSNPSKRHAAMRRPAGHRAPLQRQLARAGRG
jgi:hypothetical protein